MCQHKTLISSCPICPFYLNHHRRKNSRIASNQELQTIMRLDISALSSISSFNRHVSDADEGAPHAMVELAAV
jgi:hypothetical protein